MYISSGVSVIGRTVMYTYRTMVFDTCLCLAHWVTYLFPASMNYFLLKFVSIRTPVVYKHKILKRDCCRFHSSISIPSLAEPAFLQCLEAKFRLQCNTARRTSICTSIAHITLREGVVHELFWYRSGTRLLAPWYQSSLIVESQLRQVPVRIKSQRQQRPIRCKSQLQGLRWGTINRCW